jgi:hypothetical protein
MLESLRLTPFTLQLNQAVFYPFSLSDHQTTKPVSWDIQLRRCGARQLENQGQHLFWDMHLVMYSNWTFELPFKKADIFPQKWMTELWKVDSPCLLLHLINDKPYFLFLKTLLSLFVNWHWGQGTSFLVTTWHREVVGRGKISTSAIFSVWKTLSRGRLGRDERYAYLLNSPRQSVAWLTIISILVLWGAWRNYCCHHLRGAI